MCPPLVPCRWAAPWAACGAACTSTSPGWTRSSPRAVTSCRRCSSCSRWPTTWSNSCWACPTGRRLKWTWHPSLIKRPTWSTTGEEWGGPACLAQCGHGLFVLTTPWRSRCSGIYILKEREQHTVQIDPADEVQLSSIQDLVTLSLIFISERTQLKSWRRLTGCLCRICRSRQAGVFVLICNVTAWYLSST